MQTPAPFAVVKSLNYIDRHLEETLTLSVISAQMGYSESHFTRIFKRHMGCPVMEYVKKRRLMKAYNEIIGGAKIINAAFNCGYDSHGGFAKAFKAEFGCSPAFLKTMVTQMDYLGGNFMDVKFIKHVDDSLTKSQLYFLLQGELRDRGIKMDFDRLDSVFKYACEAYGALKRYSGSEYVTHPLNVALILTQMEAGEYSVLAGMLCDILMKTDRSEAEVLKHVPKETGEILIKLKNFNPSKVLLPEDENPVMVKLAERLHNMRTADAMKPEARASKARETIELFIPVAGRLGNEKLISELRDLSMKYISAESE